MFGGAERALIAEKMRQVFEDDAEVVVEANYLSKSGTATPYLLCGARIECRGQYYLCGMGLDISRRREQEEQLRLRERALHATANGIVIARCGGKNNPIDYVNPAFERISGYRADEVLGRDARFMAAPGLDDKERLQLRDAIAERREVNVIFRNLRKDGELFWNDLTITPVLDEHGTVSHFIGVLNDVTASKQRTAHLEHEVNHDALTGLANRTLLWDRLEQALHMAQRNKTLVATVLIDLNDFKLINDSFGHDAGDEVLTVVAKRLLAAVRDSDTVARLSGDEFVLVLVNQPSLRYTLRMVERLRLAMSKPVAFGSREIPVGASMGVSVYPHDGDTVFDLVRAADVAMYHAKATGKSDVHFFSPDMKSSTEAREKLEGRMRSAIDDDEIFLLFQPRQCLRSGKVTGIEALLRWRHPEHGILLPASFLPEAEENGLIIPFGERVLDLVCGFMRQWRAGGHPELVVSMNASYREFSQHNFVARIADQLGKYGLPCQGLELELKEEALLRNPHLGREIAGQLRESGMKLSIDAFGDGNTSLSFLQKLPVTHLKMARSSVREINPESRAGPLVKAMIDIAHDLDLCVVAEGVETRSQLDFLKSHGCDEMQGSYFSEPLEPAALERFIRSAA
jgi:diguanylate cyclase (GGDEF)-like protein/PAS domain S-box-containing protein